MNVKRIALFASGSGSNAQKIIEYFADSELIKVDCLLSNKPDAFALERARNAGVDTLIFNREQFYHTSFVYDWLHSRKIDLIVLAGFLWLVPENLVREFEIVNIHPALLPKYGGKNMYGMNVHKAVIEQKEKYSGITIHYVNEQYDDGAIIFQATCTVSRDDSPETLAEKIHALEHQYYPTIIEETILKSTKS
jgi:phosphoribosylglycinamide formyltransferase-1